MIPFDTGVVITALIAIISLSAWVGSLSQRVKGHTKTIENNRKQVDTNMERLRTENREDHRMIYAKLEELNLFLRHGKTK